MLLNPLYTAPLPAGFTSGTVEIKSPGTYVDQAGRVQQPSYRFSINADGSLTSLQVGGASSIVGMGVGDRSNAPNVDVVIELRVAGSPVPFRTTYNMVPFDSGSGTLRLQQEKQTAPVIVTASVISNLSSQTALYVMGMENISIGGTSLAVETFQPVAPAATAVTVTAAATTGANAGLASIGLLAKYQSATSAVPVTPTAQELIDYSVIAGYRTVSSGQQPVVWNRTTSLWVDSGQVTGTSISYPSKAALSADTSLRLGQTAFAEGSAWVYSATGTANGGTIIPNAAGGVRVRQAVTRLNVKDFGAAGDGVTDDTPFVNAAVAVANATPGGQVVVYFPPGNYKVENGLAPITREYISFEGDGPNATLLIHKSGNLFEWRNDGGAVRKMTVSYRNGFGTDPVLAYHNNANDIEYDNLRFDRVHAFLRLGSATSTASSVYVSNIKGSVDNGGQALIECNNGAGLYANGLRLFVFGVTNPVHPALMTTVIGTNVLRCSVKTWDTVQFKLCTLERFGSFLDVNLPASAYALNWQFTGVLCDFFRNNAVQLNTSGGFYAGFQFVGCYFVSWEGTGIKLSGSGDDITISGTRLYQCGDSGLLVNSTLVTGVTLVDCPIYGTNRNASGAPSVAFYGGVKRFTVSGCDINHDATGVGITWRSAYGVAIDPDCDEYSVTNTRSYGTALGWLIGENTAATTKRLIQGNAVQDYSGVKSGANYTIPASTVAWANRSAFRVSVSVSGGTVTGISVAGAATGLTSGTFTVNPGEVVALTYSVAPTWTVRALN